MVFDIDPTVDYVSKRIFGSEGHEAILADLLSSALRFPPGRPIHQLRLQNPFSDKDFAEEKVSILDVRAEDAQGRRFDVEMEKQPLWVFRQRTLYYWADLHSSQLLEGEDYWTIRPTYSLCFLGKTLFEDEHYHHVFRPVDVEHGNLIMCKDLEMHFVELPKFKLTAEEIRSGLERWTYFLKHGSSLDSDQLPTTLDTPMIRRALEVLKMLSQNEPERQLYLARLRAQRDEATFHNLEGARRSGHEEGFDEGFEKGEKKGLIRQLHSFQRFLHQTLTSTEELMQLSLSELEQLTDQWEQQAFASGNGTSSS